MLPVFLTHGTPTGKFDIGGIRRGNVSGSVIAPNFGTDEPDYERYFLRICAVALSGRPWIDVADSPASTGVVSIAATDSCDVTIFGSAWKGWSWDKFASTSGMGCVWSRNTSTPNGESDPLHSLQSVSGNTEVLSRVRVIVTRPGDEKDRGAAYPGGIDGFVADISRSVIDLAGDPSINVVHVWLQGSVSDGLRRVSGSALTALVSTYLRSVGRSFLGSTLSVKSPRIRPSSPFAYRAMADIATVRRHRDATLTIMRNMMSDATRVSGAGVVIPSKMLTSYLLPLARSKELSVITLDEWDTFALTTSAQQGAIPGIEYTYFLGCGGDHVNGGLVRADHMFTHLLEADVGGLLVCESLSYYTGQHAYISSCIAAAGQNGLGKSPVLATLHADVGDLRSYRVVSPHAPAAGGGASAVYDSLQQAGSIPMVGGGVFTRPLPCIGPLLMSCASGVLTYASRHIPSPFDLEHETVVAHVVPSMRVCRYGHDGVLSQTAKEYYSFVDDALGRQCNVIYVCMSPLFNMRAIKSEDVIKYECVYVPSSMGGFSCVSYMTGPIPIGNDRAYFICVDALDNDYMTSPLRGLGGSLALDHRNYLGIGRDVASLMMVQQMSVKPSGHALGGMAMYTPHFLMYLREVWINLKFNSSIYDSRLSVDEPTSGRYHSLDEYAAAVNYITALVDGGSVPPWCALRDNVPIFGAFLGWIRTGPARGLAG